MVAANFSKAKKIMDLGKSMSRPLFVPLKKHVSK